MKFGALVFGLLGLVLISVPAVIEYRKKRRRDDARKAARQHADKVGAALAEAAQESVDKASAKNILFVVVGMVFAAAAAILQYLIE